MAPEGHVQRSRKPRRAEKKQRQRQTVQTEEISQEEGMKDLPPIQRRIAKDLQITKLGDDQERRAKWRKTEGRACLASTKKIVDGEQPRKFNSENLLLL